MEKVAITDMTLEEALDQGIMGVAVMNALLARGWASYSLGTGGPILFQEFSQVEEFIQFGREKLMLDRGVRYLLLPLVDKDADPMAVIQCMDEVVKQVRGPYFFDMVRTADGATECKGSYLIDSVKLTESDLEITVDVRGPKAQGNIIVIPLGEAPNVIIEQVMLALRGPERWSKLKGAVGIKKDSPI